MPVYNQILQTVLLAFSEVPRQGEFVQQSRA